MTTLRPNLELGPYLTVIDKPKNIISIFDELRYDRADADMISPAMRRHVTKKLKTLGFNQKSGNIIENTLEDIQCIIPKSHALGASPFDILRYTKKRLQDYYILTPTQTACQLIESYSTENAVLKIAELIEKQPINVNRVYDYLEDNETHKAFLPAIPHLRYLQRLALASEPLYRMRALK